jgi:hypothetical protein
MLLLRTLGAVAVEGGEAAGAATQRKPQALLVALALAGETGISRTQLVSLLWPQVDPEHGRNTLRQTLYALRRDLRHTDLILGTTELRLNPDVMRCDAVEFDDALARGDADMALMLYRGHFLDGFRLPGAPGFEAWAAEQRERFARRAAGAGWQAPAYTPAAAGEPAEAAVAAAPATGDGGLAVAAPARPVVEPSLVFTGAEGGGAVATLRSRLMAALNAMGLLALTVLVSG